MQPFNGTVMGSKQSQSRKTIKAENKTRYTDVQHTQLELYFEAKNIIDYRVGRRDCSP